LQGSSATESTRYKRKGKTKKFMAVEMILGLLPGTEKDGEDL
jgi:hypothetical protein